MKTPLWIRQGIRFGIVGIMNTLLTFLVFVLLFRLMGMNEFIANGAGYVAGVINSFFWNKFWTFRSGVKSNSFKAKEVLLFLLVFAVSLSLQMLLFKYLLSMHLLAELAEIIAMVLYTIINFTGNKLLTFRKAEE
jgi:putative flippase GtrA